MVFHVGVLWRLNEVGYLKKVDRISSVSGGSITSAVLGMNWKGLDFDAKGAARNLETLLAAPIHGLADRTIDARSVLSGLFLPGTISEKVAASYDKHLFHGKTLQDLPDHPRFVINATNVQSGALWRFSKPYMADYRVGRVNNPITSLAVAVGASSAFPPPLSPTTLRLSPGLVQPMQGVDLNREPYTTAAVLTDGGVYDNLGLETVWKSFQTVLVSDAGGQMEPEEDPKGDWPRHSLRVLNLIDNQVRNLRKRQVIDSYRSGERRGAYWGIRTNIADYQLPTALPCPLDRTTELADTPTRLKKMDRALQERLVNWGYAVCDAALRKHVDAQIAGPKGFPYKDRGV
jgi:NTE family protein